LRGSTCKIGFSCFFGGKIKRAWQIIYQDENISGKRKSTLNLELQKLYDPLLNKNKSNMFSILDLMT